MATHLLDPLLHHGDAGAKEARHLLHGFGMQLPALWLETRDGKEGSRAYLCQWLGTTYIDYRQGLKHRHTDTQLRVQTASHFFDG